MPGSFLAAFQAGHLETRTERVKRRVDALRVACKAIEGDQLYLQALSRLQQQHSSVQLVPTHSCFLMV